jgi:predicted phosphodiesterase
VRLAALSDVHGNLRALEAVLGDLATHAPDAIVNLGDWVTGPLWPRETYELLDSLGALAVRGNHDRWLHDGQAPSSAARSVRHTTGCLSAAQIDRLGTLPTTVRLDHDVLLVHGTPERDVDYLLEDPVDGRLALATTDVLGERLRDAGASLVLCGHSHHQHAALAAGGVMVVNPGSVGCPRYADNEVPGVAEAGSPHACYAVLTRRRGRWDAALHRIAYDWDEVANRAAVNGRLDWARAFLRGAS